MENEGTELNEKKIRKVRVRSLTSKPTVSVKIWENSYEKVKQCLNSNSKRPFSIQEVLDYAVQKLDESDIKGLRDRFYTARDRFLLRLEETSKTEGPISEEQFLDKLLEKLGST